MVALLAQLRAKVSPTPDEQKTVSLRRPGTLRRSKSSSRKKKLETPTRKIRELTLIIKPMNFLRRLKGIDSPLGEALLAFLDVGASYRPVESPVQLALWCGRTGRLDVVTSKSF